MNMRDVEKSQAYKKKEINQKGALGGETKARELKKAEEAGRSFCVSKNSLGGFLR
jgi:hypothetical protein